MGKEYRAKVFRSGNSVALRLPKVLGLHDGDEMILREEAGKFTFEPAPVTPQRIDLSGIYGSIPGLEALSREARGFDDWHLDWDGERSTRG